MNEIEFLDSIDCCFPYDDESQWQMLILQGKRISVNASFGVLHEISRKPFSNKVSEQEQLVMLNHWHSANKHPLAELVIEAAKANITGNLLSVEQVLKLLDQASTYPNQYNALNIIYFACDDAQGLVDEKMQQIVNTWESDSREN